MIHTTETLDWCVFHIYQKDADSEKVELSLPFEEMMSICEKHAIANPELGSGEASYAAFKEWIEKHEYHKEKFYGSEGLDIDSLVMGFDEDLRNSDRISGWNIMEWREGK